MPFLCPGVGGCGSSKKKLREENREGTPRVSYFLMRVFLYGVRRGLLIFVFTFAITGGANVSFSVSFSYSSGPNRA